MYVNDHFKLLYLSQASKYPFYDLWQHLESKDGPLCYQLTIMNLFLNLVVNTEILIQQVACHSNQMTMKSIQF